MKQKTLIFIIGCIIFSFGLINAQKRKKSQDREAIKTMCGCYEVSFNFIETCNYSNDSTYQPSEQKHDQGLEWIQLIEDKNDKIVMQHLLIVGNPNKPHIIKHWREDWLFENTDFYVYDMENEWRYLKMPKNEIIGQWTQKVFQVDDGPRYEGSGSWVRIDEKNYWESMAYAPLPRRELTKRNDYNVTLRRNRIELIDDRWVHNQYNDKIIREKCKEEVILAQEKGENIYMRVDDSKCRPAQNWWKENKAIWQLVRNNWKDIFDQKRDLKLKDKVNNKRLYEYLFDLSPSVKNEEVKKIISSFVDYAK